MNDFLTLGPDGRVAEHEGKTLDYKRDLSGPEGVLRTVVAFANSAGGRLVIGVADDRSVVGVDDPVTAEMRLADLITDSIRPQLLPATEKQPAHPANRQLRRAVTDALRRYQHSLDRKSVV